MFHSTAKIAELLLTPTNALVLVAAFGFALRCFPATLQCGNRLSFGTLGLLIVLGLAPVGDLLLDSLQTRFPKFSPDNSPVHGIIILGGLASVFGSPDSVRWQPNEAADRLFETVELAQAFPNAPVIISAGPDHVVGSTGEADAIASYLATMGVKRERLRLERRSRDTFENAQFSAAMVKPTPGERWLLVTSAYHMPRAVGCFRKAGFQVTAAPADDQPRQRLGGWSASRNLSKVDLAAKEYIGLLVYRLSGKTSALVPAP